MNKPSTASILFHDRSTLILREMLASSSRKWTVRTLADTLHVSTGLVSRVINTLDNLNLSERVVRGRNGYTSLMNREKLIKLWTDYYKFQKNRVESYYSPSTNLVKKTISFLKQNKIDYALTLHSGANLITNYFPFDECHIYVPFIDINQLVQKLSSKITLRRLTKGGNVHFIQPYYETSFGSYMQRIKGFNVVSNLQLYLDLFHFYPRGNEHADYLKSSLGEKLYV